MTEHKNRWALISKAVVKWAFTKLVEPKLLLAVAALSPSVVIWFGRGSQFFVTKHLVLGWQIALATFLSVIGFGLAASLIVRHFSKPKPKWFTWHEVDWRLTPAFFAVGKDLPVDFIANLWDYLYGPFCPKRNCMREMEIINLCQGGSGFSVAMARCSCDNELIQFDFQHEITGHSEVRAVLLSALKEAQAMVRRRERFRDSP